MESHEAPFNWIELPEGRARFSGDVRGVDELGHETFAIEIEGNEYFGEIKSAFLPNKHDFNAEIVSFGYRDAEFVGQPMRPGICHVLTMSQVAIIQSILVGLIAQGQKMAERPNVLMEYPNSHFMGEVLFHDGWALVGQQEISS